MSGGKQSVMGTDSSQTFSQQLQWLKDGLPKTLWKPMTSRTNYILDGKIPLLRQFFDNQEFVKSEQCSCSECDELFEDPLQLNCGHTFCTECIADCEQCPKCNVPLQLDDDGIPLESKEISIHDRLGNAQLACPLGDCTWKGLLSEIIRHVDKNCEYRPMQCPFVKCRAFLVRCQLGMHERLCPNQHLGTKLEKRARNKAEREKRKASEEANATDSSVPPFGGINTATQPQQHQQQSSVDPLLSLGNDRPAPPQAPHRSSQSERHAPPTPPARTHPIMSHREPPTPPMRRQPAPPPQRLSQAPLAPARRTPPTRSPPVGRPARPHLPQRMPLAMPMRRGAPAPTPPRRKPKSAAVMDEELVLDTVPDDEPDAPPERLINRMSVLVGNIGALQMKLKDQNLPAAQRTEYETTLEKSISDHQVTVERVHQVAPEMTPQRIEISKPTEFKKDREAVKRMLAAAGIDANSIYDDEHNGNAAPNDVNTPVSPRIPISKPTEVHKNRDAVRKMLADAGIDADTVLSNDEPTSGKSPPISPRIPISKPTEFKKDRAAVEQLLAQAGIDAKSVLPADDTAAKQDASSQAGKYGTWTGSYKPPPTPPVGVKPAPPPTVDVPPSRAPARPSANHTPVRSPVAPQFQLPARTAPARQAAKPATPSRAPPRVPPVAIPDNNSAAAWQPAARSPRRRSPRAPPADTPAPQAAAAPSLSPVPPRRPPTSNAAPTAPQPPVRVSRAAVPARRVMGPPAHLSNTDTPAPDTSTEQATTDAAAPTTAAVSNEPPKRSVPLPPTNAAAEASPPAPRRPSPITMPNTPPTRSPVPPRRLPQRGAARRRRRSLVLAPVGRGQPVPPIVSPVDQAQLDEKMNQILALQEQTALVQAQRPLSPRRPSHETNAAATNDPIVVEKMNQILELQETTRVEQEQRSPRPIQSNNNSELKNDSQQQSQQKSSQQSNNTSTPSTATQTFSAMSTHAATQIELMRIEKSLDNNEKPIQETLRDSEKLLDETLAEALAMVTSAPASPTNETTSSSPSNANNSSENKHSASSWQPVEPIVSPATSPLTQKRPNATLAATMPASSTPLTTKSPFQRKMSVQRGVSNLPMPQKPSPVATTSSTSLKPSVQPISIPPTHSPAGSSKRTPRTPDPGVFVDLDAPLPGDEMLIDAHVAWRDLSTKLRISKHATLRELRAMLISNLAKRNQLPEGVSDAAPARYKLFARDASGGRGHLLESGATLAEAGLTNLDKVWLEEDKDYDTRRELVNVGRSLGAPAVKPPPPSVARPPSSKRPSSPDAPPPPPALVEDDDGGVLTRRSAPVSRQRRDERRGGDRRRSDVDHHDDKPLSPAISALLKLHAKKHYEEVEAILTTMSPQDRHRFKSEVRRRKEQKDYHDGHRSHKSSRKK